MPLPDLNSFPAANPDQIDWLARKGVSEEVILATLPLRCAQGRVARDGRLDLSPDGKPFIIFPEAEDLVFWQPRTGELATWNGRAIALGEDAIDNATTYAFGYRLNVLSNPLEWLRHGCDGIVVIDWSRAWSRLHTAPRIALSEDIQFLYRRHMKPPRMPDTTVLTSRRAA